MKSNTTLYPQLKNLYSLEDFLKQPLGTHTSIFITPNGNVFNLRIGGELSHIQFALKFYENYTEVKSTLENTEKFSSNYDELLDQGLTTSELQELYLDEFSDLHYYNFDLYQMLKLHWLSIENLLVSDLGFVLISQDVGMTPQIVTPLGVYGKHITNSQRYATLEVLEKLQDRTKTFYRPKLLLSNSLETSNLFSNKLASYSTILQS